LALDLHDAQSAALLTSAGELFEKLRRLSFDGVGITREAFGAGETAAHALVEEYALTAGLDVTRDRAGNLCVTLQGHEAQPFIATGSHLDSVPRGGNYDGAAGVVAGVLVLSALARQHIARPRCAGRAARRGHGHPR
jgi:N-carbamoyl-L-amino-acid hydrolase